MKLTEYLDRVASALELKGFLKEAYDLDVIANTLDLITAPAPVTERERNEEFNYAVINVKKNAMAAKQELQRYWGPQWGQTMFNIANRQAQAGRSIDMFPQWQKASLQAKQEKSHKMQVEPKQDDYFMSPEERAKVNKPVVENSPFTRS